MLYRLQSCCAYRCGRRREIIRFMSTRSQLATCDQRQMSGGMLEPLGSFRIIATGLVVAMAKLKHGITRARTGCWRFPAVGWLALGCAIVLGHLTAMAQSNPIPLTGGAVTKMITDYQRPYIYAIQAPVSGGLHGNLLFINTTNNSIDKTLAIGINPTDMTINGAENVLYIIDYGYNTTYRVDLNAQTLLSPFHLGTNL